MTKQEYTTITTAYSIRDITAFCEKNLILMTMQERIERYGNIENWTGFSIGKGHMLYVGRMANLFKRAMLMGATKDELTSIGNQLMIGIDAVKHRLNYKQAEEDHHIAVLKEKYSLKNFMALDASTLLPMLNKTIANVLFT